MGITGVMQSILRFFAEGTGNLAWAIIIVTTLIRAALHPLQVKQVRLMEQMKEITPKVQELEKKYKGQPEEYQRRVAELYRDNNVNPAVGCLSMLIPLPFFVIFYRVLQDTAFIGGMPEAAKGFLWIKDFALPDAWALPILSAATTWLSSRQTATDPSQKSMAIIMPIFMGWIAMRMPAGAALYWVTNNLISVVQQWLIQRQLAAAKKGVS
ncbi:MAG: YidC/Oxa1 family membrane protein insertase [Bacillota bacterium]